MAIELIEKDLDGKGKIRAFLVSGSPDLIALTFYKNVYPEIGHLDVFNNDLLKVCIENILDSEYEHMLFLDRVEIKPEYRGMGLAKKAVSDIFNEYGVEFSLLVASPMDEDEKCLDLESLISFYEGLGYSKIHKLDLDMGELMCFI